MIRKLAKFAISHPNNSARYFGDDLTNVVTQSSQKFCVAKPSRFAIMLVTKPVPGTLQEGGASFQTTHWTVVLQARQTESSQSAQQALSAFCEAYWPPLYSFLRRRGYSSADAEDLVQSFFVFLLAEKTLSRADQERGRLRTFLLTSLRNFAMDERDRSRTLKRGGRHQILSFDEHHPEVEAAMLATAHLDDIGCYDLSWASNVAKRAWQNLHQALAAEGKGKWLEELKPFIAGAGATPANQDEVAARLNVPVATLRTWLSRLRQRYRNLLRLEVASTVSDPTDVNDELQYLHRILMS
jgi:RNA polymerase sigma factor (sigma-70 family)